MSTRGVLRLLAESPLPQVGRDQLEFVVLVTDVEAIVTG